MSSFPNFSNVPEYVVNEFNSRAGNILKISQLNAWIRIASAVGTGCQIISNPNFSLFADKGASLFGNFEMSGTIGLSWDGKTAVNAEGEFMGFRPRPNITSIEIDEGAGNLSRKANFTITCYTKAQMDTVCKYFLEPGYTIFIEWGWNTISGVAPYDISLNAGTVAKYQKFQNVNDKRKQSLGQYDNYLGFITGGSVSTNGDTWQIQVKLTGFTELPAYLMVTDKIEGQEDTAEDDDSAEMYEPNEISAQTDLGKQRFMMMFNRLPSNRLSKTVSALLDTPQIAHPANFINFDETVKGKINDESDGWNVLGFQIKKGSTKSEGGKVEMPDGTKIIGDHAFIRFGTLMEILNCIIEGQFKLADGTSIKLKINTKNTICNAFQRIFSTDKTKLFIPNAYTPKFSLLQASKSTTPQTDLSQNINNSIEKENNGVKLTVLFPYNQKLSGGKVTKNGETIEIQTGGDETFIGLSKNAFTYGFLDDLYVNIDFVKGIIETKNFSVKDALYQILNGMSSAAGGIWDFNIIESTDGTELRVVDLNLVADTKAEPVKLQLMGTDSIFIDASLDLDISGAKMNQIIGNRLGKKVNPSQKEIKGKKKGLFSDLDDMILTQIEITRPKIKTQAGKEQTAEEKKKAEDKAKEKNVQIFLDRVGYAPRISLTGDSKFNVNIEDITFLCAFNDQVAFQTLKSGQDKIDRQKDTEISALMPIKFTGTVHGISGIKRGDKFKISGLPKEYENSGFFQVTSVKHTIDNMIWKTEFEGGFRKQLAK